MAAWTETGQDVHQQLMAVFGLTPADWSTINHWWMQALATDFDRMEDYSARVDTWEAQYKEAAGVSTEDPDADIQF